MFCDNVWTKLLTEESKKKKEGRVFKGIGFFHLNQKANKQNQNKLCEQIF